MVGSKKIGVSEKEKWRTIPPLSFNEKLRDIKWLLRNQNTEIEDIYKQLGLPHVNSNIPSTDNRLE